jgi:agmatinase
MVAPAGASEAGEFGEIDVALVGVPMDLGVTNRAGARLGPRAVRAVERIGPYEHVLKMAPMGMLKVADIGDVPMRSRFSLEQCMVDIEAFFRRLRAANVMALAVGGDHSITYPILKALGEGGPVGMVHIDAHCDSAGEFEGSKFHHGGPFRQAVLEGVLDPERSIQIGIRGGASFLWEFSYESGMTVLSAEEVVDMGIAAVVAKARAVVGEGPTYVTFDVDGIDPAFAPGTGTPEVGGLTPREALAILRGLAGLDIVGGDVVEVAPQYDRLHDHGASRCADALHRALPDCRQSEAAPAHLTKFESCYGRSACQTDAVDGRRAVASNIATNTTIPSTPIAARC